MWKLLKTLFIPIISLMCMALGSGLFTTFVSIRLELAGAAPSLIGLAASSFNGGILAGAILSPRLATKLGCSRSLLLIYAINTGAILLHALRIDPIYWICLRFCSGMALGGFFTVMESWFLKASLPAMRSQALSLYLIAYYFAVSGGQLLLNTVDPLLYSLFFMAAAFSASAAIPLFASKKDLPSFESTPAPPAFLGRRSLGYFCAIASGIVIASIYGLVPYYGKAVGLTLGQISLLMSVIISGGFLFQWPLGKWSDTSGHTRVLKTVCLLAMLFSLSAGIIDGLSFPWLLLICWLFGGASFALYPLSLAFLCEGVGQENLPGLVGKFVAAYSIGAILGPLATSFCIEMIGAPGLFYFLGFICAASGMIVSLKRSGDPANSA